jgi:hypothetical protein
MKTILLFTFCLVGSLSFGQANFDGEIRWGEEIKMKRKEIGPMPIGVADGSLYSTKRVKKDTYLQELSLQSLSITEQSEMNFKHNGFDLTSMGNFVFADRPIFMTSYIDKKEGKRHYLLHELENNDLGKPIELATVPYIRIGMIGARKKVAEATEKGAYSFNRVVSDDHETMMISFKNEDGQTETVLYDKDLEEVSRQEMEMPFENFQMTTGRLSNNGRYFMIGYEFEMEESKVLMGRDKKVAGDYHMLMFDAVNGEMEDVVLDIDKDIYSSALKIMDDGSCVVYGMYSNEDASGVSGAFFQKLDAKYNVDFTTLEEFEEDFITQFWSDRAKKKAEKKKKKKNAKKKEEPSLYSYIMHDLAIKENGDMVLLAEQYYMYITRQTYSNGNGGTYTVTTYHYHYNDVIAVNCSQNGSVTWKQKVQKRQYSTNDGGYYSSFYTIVQENDILLMYNDKEANMEDADEAGNVLDKRKQRRNTIAALITLSDDGESAKNTLFDFEEDASRRLVPKQCKKMSDTEILLYTTAKGNSRILGWMTL